MIDTSAAFRWPSRSFLQELDRPGGIVVVSPDGRTLATPDGVWDFPSLHLRSPLIGHNDRITHLAIAPDGRKSEPLQLRYVISLDYEDAMHSWQRQFDASVEAEP